MAGATRVYQWFRRSGDFVSARSVLVELIQSEPAWTSQGFRRAANQRLVAAHILFQSRVYLDAVYLGGYAVECVLKSLILARTPKSKLAITVAEVASGAKAHNLDFLRAVLRWKGVAVPSDVASQLAWINDRWTVHLRYLGTQVPDKEVADFLTRVQAVQEWVERSL